MRKGLLVILAFALVAAMAAPAMAELSVTGFIRSAAITSNYLRYDGQEVFPVKFENGRSSTALNPVAEWMTTGGSNSPGRGQVQYGSFGEFKLVVPAPNQATTDFVNTKSSSGSYLETRARIRFEAKEEKVGAVFFFEIDSRWGDVQYVSGRRNGGFGLEADTINLETKNVYVWFKPAANMTFNVGLQNYTDFYQGVLFGAADFAGIVGEVKLEPVDLRFGYAKLKDSNNLVATSVSTANSSTGLAAVPSGQNAIVNGKNQDTDVWFIEAHMSPNKESRVGLNFHYLNDRAFQAPTGSFSYTPDNTIFTMTESAVGYNSAKIYTLGIDGSYQFDKMFGLNGFAFMQFGKVKGFKACGNTSCSDNVATDHDAKGYAVDLRLDVAAGPGKGFIEGLYVSGQKEDSDDITGIINASNYANAGSLFNRTDMEILLPGILDANTAMALVYDPKGPAATTSGAGLGLFHIAAGYTMPVAPKLTAKFGIGWAQTAQKRNWDGYVSDKNLGTEINGRLTYNIAKGLDLQGAGAYCWLGKFYDPGNAFNFGDGNEEPNVKKADNLYKVYARLNYSF